MWVAPFVNLWSYFLLFSDTVGWAPHLVCFTAPLMRWPSPSCICAASWSCLNLKFVPIKRYLYFSFLINSTIHHFDFFVWLFILFFMFQCACSSLLLHVKCRFYKSVLWPSPVTDETWICRKLRLQQLSQELLARSSPSDTPTPPAFFLSRGLLTVFHWPP